MDDRWIEFVSGTLKAIEAELIISKEEAPNGWEYITITRKDYMNELYGFWNKPEKKKNENLLNIPEGKNLT